MRLSWKAPGWANSFMWHIWFAWRPVITTPMENGVKELVWLDTCLRRRKSHGYGWEYTTEP